MPVIDISCRRCGEKFRYNKKPKGRARSLCDLCKEVHAPRNFDATRFPHDFHVNLSDEDREKAQFIMRNLGVDRIEAIRTAIRVYHAFLLRDMSRRP
jgi:hypothetical protein